MSATQDFVALEWIRGELANTLQSAQVALEAVAEDADDTSSMRSCLTAIHQVHGTLKMVALEGPTMMAGEMEAVAQSLMNNATPDLRLGQETLMQAILQLPAYLDRLHREQQDTERNYLPMVNNLRAARGEERIPGSEPEDAAGSGGPDFSPLTEPPSEDVVNAFFKGNGEGNLPKIRARYQATLAAILKKKDVRENLSTLGKLFTMLDRLCGDSPMGNLADLGLAVVEGIASGGLKLDNTSAVLLRGIDAELKKLAEQGQEGLSNPIDLELGKKLVELVNTASKDTKNIAAVKARYVAAAPEPEEVAIGPDDETMSAVAKILIEELNAVTDKLDLYVRAEKRNSADLVALKPNLEQIASTMVILGDADQQATVLSQIDVIKEIEGGIEPDEEVLLSMAQALLHIEASLGALVTETEEGAEKDDFANLNEANAAVVRETRTGLAAAKDQVIEFFMSNFDHSKVEELPAALNALRGGLVIVEQARAGDVLVSASGYVQWLLNEKVKPDADQMDDLADALTSVDYYLERLLENASDPYLQMLEVAENAVAKLGFAVGEEPSPAKPEPEEPEPASEAAEPVAEEPAEETPTKITLEDLDEFEIEEVEPEAVNATPPEAPAKEPEAVAAPEPAEVDDSLVDDEILEIFIDEAEEVLETINEFLPQWQQDATDEEALGEVRRAFHTLKGSGRMVGATVVGELAWSVENLLNRIIDGAVTPGPEVMDIVSTVVARIPEGVEAFKAGDQNQFEPSAMAAVADALADGRTLPALEEAAETSAPEAAVEIEAAAQDVLEEIPEEVSELEIDEAPELELDEVAEETEEAEQTVSDEVPELTLEEPDAPDVEFELEDIETDLDSSFETELEAETADDIELEEIQLDVPAESEDGLLEVESASGEADELDTLDEDFDAMDFDEVEEIELTAEPPEEETAEEVEAEIEAEDIEDSFDFETVDEDSGLELEEIAVEMAADEEPAVDAAAGIELDELEDALEALESELVSEDDSNVLPDASDTDALLESDDLSLEEIFSMEAEEKLLIIDAFVEEQGEVSGDLVAAFHTLKGSAAMAEIESISTVAAPMEHLSNDYLLQSKATDEFLVSACRDAATLIRAVLEDIDSYRSDIEGSQALLARLAGGADADQAAAQEPGPTFDFTQIILLSEANIAADGWQDIDALIAELKLADEQAKQLNQDSLVALIESMLRIYAEAPGRPDELTLSLMKRAHDHLVFMFDAIASSQAVRPADRVIAELDKIDLSAFAPAVETESTAAAEPVAEEAAPAEAPEAAAPVIAAVVQLPEDDVDEDILPIFLEESEELLEEIDASILGWTESGEPGDHLDNLLRQLHTVKGGARMAGAASLGEYTHNFETFLIGVQNDPPSDEAFFALLNSQQDEIIRRVEVYQKLSTGSATDEELESLKTAPSLEAGVPVATSAAPEATKAPEAASETVSEATKAIATETAAEQPAAAVVTDNVVELPEDDVDEDILPIFLEESDDLVEELESSIQSWSESPGDMDTLDVLLRNLHTLKGGARMAGLNSLGEYAHNFETFLIGIQQNPVELDDDFFTLLAKRQDEVIRRVEIYKKLSVGGASEADLASLRQAIEPTIETEPAQDAPADQAVPAEDAKPEEAKAATPAADKQASANQEMVRVSADLLEELISLAGESSITRGRVEQQITDFGDALQEMEETINRIRDQVRRLEIEAESRETLIRSQASDSAFDELEMDRYTMLQTISRALNEASSDMMDLKDTLVNRSRDAETLLHQQARAGGELQEGLTRTRMVPFARLIPRLRRIVRQVSGEVGKSVRFDAYNVEGELDRNVLERIVAPLEHMLRNAVDHGIEDKEKRVAAGKSEQGRISLRLSREGGYVLLTISDDGGGINVDAVRAKAIDRGLISEGQDVSDHEVMQFIMHAGFSTAQKLTQISGRGVGMDVVGSEIKALGGSITIDSTYGVGTEFTIRIPFTVSINRALMVIVREETYAVPLNTIEGIVRVSPYELEAYYQPDAPMFEYAGQPYRLGYMGKMLDTGSEDPNLGGQVAPLPVILARSGDHAVALQVDRVIGSREVVVKTLGSQFGDVGGISGATVLGDGSVVVILDCMALVRSYESVQQDPAPTAVPDEPVTEAARNVRTVMIVDDSVTVRKVTSRLMERHGFEVETAKDGVDALNQLQDLRPDVVLLDIEMPRMDGFEVLRSVRRDESLKDLPIIMITSRTGEKHKQQAMELGVNEYLGKPFQEANLLATIEEVISGTKQSSED